LVNDRDRVRDLIHLLLTLGYVGIGFRRGDVRSAFRDLTVNILRLKVEGAVILDSLTRILRE